MGKKLAAAAITASLLGGAAAGLAFAVPSLASADTGSATSSSATPATPPPWVTDALKKLVADGTIDQTQSDAVAKALEAARPPGGPRDGHGPGPGLAVAAKTIGIDEAALRTELQSGKTIADVARAHNVDLKTVIDALVTDMQSHLAADVASGRLTQAQADRMQTNASQHATDLVNGTPPARGDFGPPPGAPLPSSTN